MSLNAQTILEKAFATIKNLNTFSLKGNTLETYQHLKQPERNTTSSKSFQLFYRKPGEVVVILNDTETKYRFVGESIFIKGPEDKRARYFKNSGYGVLTTSMPTLMKYSQLPSELLTLIHFFLHPQERCLWHIQRNSFRLVETNDRKQKFILEGDLGTGGIWRLTVCQLSYFIHAIEVTERTSNPEMEKTFGETLEKGLAIFQNVKNISTGKKDPPPHIDIPSYGIQRELVLDRVALNPSLEEKDFAL